MSCFLRFVFASCISPAIFAATPSAALSQGDAAAHVLASARKAHGHVDWDHAGVLVESGSETSSGLKGRWRMAQEASSGRMHESADYGVYQTSAVWDAGSQWRQDRSGGVHLLNSAFAQANSVTATWLAKWGYLRPAVAGAHIQYSGRHQSNGRTYEALRATPPGGQQVELWFDKATGLLARSRWVMPTEITTVRYEDYRPVGALSVPFKVISQKDESDPATASTIIVNEAHFVAQAADGEFEPPLMRHDSTIADGVATVPIVYDGYVLVDAMLNGKGPFGFILDTGGHDILTPEAAKLLRLSGVGAGVSGGSGAGTVAEQYTLVESVSIGKVELRNQCFTILPLQYGTVERGARPPLSGILGLELFERFAIELNYRAQTLTFRPIQNAPAGHGIPVPITFTDDQPTFSAKIDGIVGENGLDTGNAGTLVVQGRWARANGLAQRMRQGLPTAGFGTGGMSRNWATRVDVEVAGVSFPHVVASYSEDKKGAFSSRIEAGNIGNQIYENFVLSFDYGRNTVWFDPVPDRQPQRFIYSRAGISFYKQSPSSFVVTTVVPHGPGDEAGIAAGDEIVAVDGVSSNTLSGSDLRRIVREPPGTKLVLEFMRGGQKRSATVELKELLP
jgi:PDZ domain/Aspartyl protease